MARKKTPYGEAGFALVESLASLVLVGLIATVFMVGLSLVSKSDALSREHVQAGGLARGQIELIKRQTYIDYAPVGHEEYGYISVPSGYAVQMTVTPIDPVTGNPLLPGADNGIQKVAVTVTHVGRNVMTLTDYKISR